MHSNPKTLSQLLDEVHVDDPDFWENTPSVSGWYAVSTEEQGAIAFFKDEVDAYRFRLDFINRQLNP